MTEWQNKPIVIEGINNADSVTLLGFDGKVKFSVSGSKVTITPPAISPANNPCRYAWCFKLKGAL